MKRLKIVFKAALIPALMAIVSIVAGIILFVVASNAEGDGLIIAAIVAFVIGIVCCMVTYWIVKEHLHAICPECQKFMGETSGEINYSFVCNQYKENYDSSTNKFRDFTFYYTITIVCPHCGNTSVFDYHTNAKTEAKADKDVNNYVKKILKLKN